VADKPIKFLEGKTVYLRPHQPADAELMYHSLFNHQLRRLTGTQQIFSKEAIGKYIERVGNDDSRVDMVIVLQETNELVGEVVLNGIDHLNRNCNIRIGLYDDKHFGKGYGTEAMALMVRYGFEMLNLHRISLDVFDFNPRAINVYEKLGFKQEGVQRDTLFYEGKYHNSILMSILEDDYRALQDK
jgi:RimJ/RimL family protein N-acetyltransferase